MKKQYKQRAEVVEAILLAQGDTFKVFHAGGKDISFVPKEQFLAGYEEVVVEAKAPETVVESEPVEDVKAPEAEKAAGQKFKKV